MVSRHRCITLRRYLHADKRNAHAINPATSGYVAGGGCIVAKKKKEKNRNYLGNTTPRRLFLESCPVFRKKYLCTYTRNIILGNRVNKSIANATCLLHKYPQCNPELFVYFFTIYVFFNLLSNKHRYSIFQYFTKYIHLIKFSIKLLFFPRTNINQNFRLFAIVLITVVQNYIYG